MQESLHRKLMFRIGGILIALVITFFIIFNIYFSIERKRNLLDNGRAVSTLILKKASENLERSGGSLLVLTALSIELKRTVEGSNQLTAIGFIDKFGKFVAHSDPEKIGTRCPEIFMDVNQEKVISTDHSYSAIYPLKKEPLSGLKLVVEFSKANLALSRKKYVGFQFLILVIAIAIAYVSSSAFIRSQVLNPLDKLRRHSNQVQNGDLTHFATLLFSDEIGQLTEAFNNMTESIRNIIIKISEAASDLRNSANHLSKVMGEVKNFTLEEHRDLQEMEKEVKNVSSNAINIAEKMESLGTFTQETSTSAQEIATSLRQSETEIKNLLNLIEEVFEAITIISDKIEMNEKKNELLLTEVEDTSVSAIQMSRSISQVESLTKEGLKVAQKASGMAREGMDSAEQTHRGMNKIMTVMNQIYDSVKNLERRTMEIEEILTVIQNIAGQTNLLAINASIIASQAGEQGKSFAVVAEHIKNLATRTAMSTRDIETIIKAVQKNVTGTVELVTEGTEVVEEGKNLSVSTLDVLKKLEEANLQNAQIIEQVAGAMEEQAKGSQRVSEASTHINEHTQEIVKATREQADAARNIRSAVEKMKNFSEEVMRAAEEQTRAGANIMKLVEEIFKAISQIIQRANSQKKELVNTSEKISRGTSIMGEIAQRIEGVAKTTYNLDLLSETLLNEIRKFRLE